MSGIAVLRTLFTIAAASLIVFFGIPFVVRFVSRLLEKRNKTSYNPDADISEFPGEVEAELRARRETGTHGHSSVTIQFRKEDRPHHEIPEKPGERKIIPFRPNGDD